VRPYLEKPSHKKLGWWSGGVGQGEGLDFKPQYKKKKKSFCYYFHAGTLMETPLVSPISGELKALRG
jgi:hypothetical protein